MWILIGNFLGWFGTQVNLNDMAERVTKAEGGKESLSIAQVKEVQRLVLIELSNMSLPTVCALLRRIRTNT